MNALKSSLTTLFESDPTLQALCRVSPAPVFDKTAPQDTSEAPITYPYIIIGLRPAGPLYHLKGVAARDYDVLVKGVDRGDSSKLAGQIDERIEELLPPLEPITVPGFRLGAQLRGVGVDYTETSAGVKYQHVGAIYRITLIPQ